VEGHDLGWPDGPPDVAIPARSRGGLADVSLEAAVDGVADMSLESPECFFAVLPSAILLS